VERERGRKGATGETEQGRQERVGLWEAVLVLVPGARGERERGEIFMVPTQGSKIPSDSN